MSDGARPRLLIVDDARANVEALRVTLPAHGYEVTDFTDPHEALNALREGVGFDLLLADLVMPRLDGVDLLREAQQHDPNLVGIIMTGEGTISTAVEAMKSGALDYVLKPLKLSVLLPVLSRALTLRSLKIENAVLERNVLERTSQLEQALRDLETETSERLRAEQALMQAQKLEAIGRLTGGVAHDFNNLLMAMDGAFQLLDRWLEPDHPGRKYVEMGRLATERGAKVTGELLAFSRTQRLDLQPTEISTALRNAASIVAHALGPTVSLDLNIVDADCWTRTDPGQLELALVNLATNARDAMPAGGHAELGVSHEMAADGQPWLTIWLRDTGTGMSSETAKRALEPFFTTKARGEGTGLGLAQVYAFAQQCGGDVSITSTPGGGTAIFIKLPRMPVGLTEQAPKSTDASKECSIAGEGIRLLVIDDDDAVRTIMVDGLRFQGFAVSEAANGATALQELRDQPFDAILVDYAMPGMKGDEVAREARSMKPELPVIFCSGFADTLALDSVEGARVLRKPVPMSLVARTVRELVRDPAG